MTGKRPQRSGNADALIWQTDMHFPVYEQFVQDRIETFFRRMPGFHQVIIQPDFIDRRNCCFGIRIGSQQHALGLWIGQDSLLQKFHPIHFRHALVHQEQCNRLIPLLHFFDVIQCGLPRVDRDDAIIFSIACSQVAFNCVQNRRIVIDRKNYRFCHFLRPNPKLFFLVTEDIYKFKQRLPRLAPFC